MSIRERLEDVLWTIRLEETSPTVALADPIVSEARQARLRAIRLDVQVLLAMPDGELARHLPAVRDFHQTPWL